MKHAVFALCTCLALCCASLAAAGGFDCAKPEFGAPLAQINDHDYFVPYKTDGPVSYYNYTGPCTLPLHSHVAPVIVYGFADDRLFAKIVHTSHDNLEMIKKHVPPNFAKPKQTQQGDWLTLTWYDAERKIKYKVKFNTKTQEAKSVLYDEQLRPRIEDTAMLSQ